MNEREVQVDSVTFCRSCAGASYYDLSASLLSRFSINPLRPKPLVGSLHHASGPVCNQVNPADREVLPLNLWNACPPK